MALDSLNGTIQFQYGWQAKKNKTGKAYAASTNNNTITRSYSVGTSAANAAADGGDEAVSYIVTVPAGVGQVTTLDLSMLLGLLEPTVDLARYKAASFHLLSTADDPTNGTDCTQVRIGPGQTNGNPFILGGTAPYFTLGNGEHLGWATPGAAGFPVGGTTKTWDITNEDAAHAAALEVTLYGGTN